MKGPSTEQAPGGIGSYLPQLDGLRAVAVLLVLWGHLLPGSYRGGLHVATWGVQLFFVLSGFLITRILLGCRASIDAGRTTNGRAARAFYGRRFLRIFPLYYAVLVVYALAWPDHPAKASLPWLFTYAQNWAQQAGVAIPDGLGHFWSLAVEEQFYLLWPALVLVLRPGVLRIGAWAGVLVLAIALVLWPGRAIVAGAAPFGALGLGCLLALSPGLRWTALASAAGVALLVVQLAPPTPGARELALQWGAPLAAVGLVAWASVRPRALAWALEPAPARYLGRISYGIYALHMPVAIALNRVGLVPSEGDLAAAAWCSAVTVAIAAASWRWFEAPLLQLRARLPYAPSPAPDGSPAAVRLPVV